jgi:hypothetical protein
MRMEMVLGRRMQEEVEMGGYVEVAELQCAGESEDQGHVFLPEFGGEGLVVVGWVDVCWWARGYAAGERRVVVDVEFEEVEEGVGY